MKKLLFIFLLFLVGFNGFGQNLVPNPSFETHSDCPTQVSTFFSNQLNKATPWDLATIGTADYYNQCNDTIDSTVSVPNNFVGNQPARTGVAYTGLYSFNSSTLDYREYITAPLVTSLIGGLTYYIELYVSLADKSSWNCATDGIGVYLSIGPPDSTGIGMGVLPFTPQVDNPTGNLITDKTNWTKISGTFVAAGSENYITIGNFKNDALTQNDCGGANNSYYYIEDVCVSTDSMKCDIMSVVIGNNIYNHIHIYPNPTTGKFTVAGATGEIQVYDLFGRLLLRSNKKQMDMSSYPAGLYIWSIGSARGKLVLE